VTWLWAAATAGCSFDSGGVSANMPTPDGALRDAALMDVQAPDGNLIDIDGALAIDGAIPDAAIPDAAIPDAAMPDAAIPDAALPDAFVFMDAGIVLGAGDVPTTPGAGGITVDGMFGDWPAVNTTRPISIALSSPMGHEHITPAPSDADLSARVTSISDSGAFYLRVEVMDNALRADSSNFYDDDSFNLIVDAPPNSGAAREGYRAEDRRYYFRSNGTVEDGFGGSTPAGDGITFAVVTVTGGYHLEMRIPWTVYAVATRPAPGTRLRLGLQLTDDDNGGGPERWMAFFRGASTCNGCCGGAPHQDVWCDPSVIGNLVVMP